MLDAWLGTNCIVLEFRKNRNNNRNIRLVHTPNLGSICHALGITLFALQGMHKQQEDIFKQPFHCLCAWVCLCLTPSPSVRQSVCLSTWRWAYGAHRFNFSDYFSTFWCQPPSHPATQLPSCPNAGRFSRTNHAYMFYLFRPIFTLIEVFSYCRLSHALGHVAFGFGFGFDFGFVCLLDTCKTNKSGKCRGGECFSFGEGVNKYSGNSEDYESFVLP